MIEQTTMNPGLKAAIEAAGGFRPLARAIGVEHRAVMGWDEIPVRQLLKIEEATKVPREALRPDLFLVRRPPDVRELSEKDWEILIVEFKRWSRARAKVPGVRKFSEKDWENVIVEFKRWGRARAKVSA
jgi:hypothetical protein